MDYCEITNRMKVGEIYQTDYLVTSISNELNIPKEEVQKTLDNTPAKFIKREINDEGVDISVLQMHPISLNK